MNEPVLTPQDRQSAVWQKLKKHLDSRLAALRVENDNPLDERKTAKVRGRIAEVKAMLDLDKDAPVIDDENARFKD